MNWQAVKVRTLIRDLASRPAGVTSSEVSLVSRETARVHLGKMRDEGLLFELPYGKGQPSRYFVSAAQIEKFQRDKATADSAMFARHRPKHARAWWPADTEARITEDTIVTIA